MIIHLAGAAGTGKSTFASRFVLEHPYVTFCDISGYRAEYASEKLAWENLEKDIQSYPEVIVETCGASHQLESIFTRVRDRTILTILFTGDMAELQRRVRERQKKRKPPFPYKFSDELASIEWVLDHPPDEVDLVVNTTSNDIHTIYETVLTAILNRRLADHRKAKA